MNLPKRRGSRECRMHAAPAVSRAICAKQERTRAYRFSGGNPAFPAQWLYGLLRALPGDEFLFVTVTSGLRLVLSPVGPTRLRWLGISNGCQNHTTWPYAAISTATPIGDVPTEVVEGVVAPSVRATLDHSRGNPPCDHDHARRRCVHRVQPRVRDNRDTPLLPGWMGQVIAMICPTEKGVYFLG